MFFSYLFKELRRRHKQVIFVALGLGLGIGLVVTVSAMATGVEEAQAQVLSSLYGVGTDLTITRPAQPGPPDGLEIDRTEFSAERVVSTPGLGVFDSAQASIISSTQGVSQTMTALELSGITLSGDLGEPGSQPGPLDAGGDQDQPPATFDFGGRSILGLDVAALQVPEAPGPLAPSQVSRGRSFASDDAGRNVAIVDASYASSERIALDERIKVGDERLTVIGLADAAVGGAGSDIYVPLGIAQAVADERGKINTVYVKAQSADLIPAVQNSLEQALPNLDVASASDLASQVAGSLESASDLSTNLGRWLSLAVLIAAIALASMLTMSGVGRRTRELGTLKAIGWRGRRVVGQVMGEAFVQGILGGLVGIVIGLLGAWAVGAFMPSLSASVDSVGGFPGGGPSPFAQQVEVAVGASIDSELIALAIGLSVLGGVIAGALGGWRASRLRPADAMRALT